MTNDPRFPVGTFASRDQLTADERRAMIDEIAATPARLRDTIRNLTDAQLDTPYRDGGWTVRQVIHHVPDSHLNAYIRTKLALTEETPTIKPYDEAVWATLEDSRVTPVEVSLALLESLHARWVGLLRSLDDAQFARTFRHPEHTGPKSIDWLVALYSWHGRHHTGHITALRERNGW